jgi:hypothetical protein
MVKGKLVTVRLEMVLNLMQDRRTVCAKHTIGLKIVLDIPMEPLADEAQVEACFGPFGDVAILATR